MTVEDVLQSNTLGSIYSSTNPEKAFRERCIIQQLFNNLIPMFDYKNLPDTLEGRYIEIIYRKHGFCGFGKINEKVYAVPSSPMGKADQNGIGTKIVGACPLGEIKGTIGKDVVLGWNNALGAPDDYIYWLTHLLEQTDFSIKMNIKYSRNKPMPIVTDTRQKTAIDTALKNLDSEELTAVLSENALAQELGGDPLPVLNLSDVKNADKIQYLSALHDDLMRRFYNRNGLGVQSKNKQAQVNSDELHSMDSNAWVEPLNQLYYRKKAVEELNKVFKFEPPISVDFGNVWKDEYEKYKRSLADPTAEPMAEEKGESSADESADESANGKKGGKENV